MSGRDNHPYINMALGAVATICAILIGYFLLGPTNPARDSINTTGTNTGQSFMQGLTLAAIVAIVGIVALVLIYAVTQQSR